MNFRSEVLGRALEPYKFYKMREEQLVRNSGGEPSLPLHDSWRLKYYRNPYLILEEDQTISGRFYDIMANTFDISSYCKIDPTPLLQNDFRLTRLLTEVIEETNWRKLLTEEILARVHSDLQSYFSAGEPAGCRMFRDTSDLTKDRIVKFSKPEYVKDMLDYGRFRISPASEYSKGSYLKAIKDFETKRPLKIRALETRLKGDEYVEMRGKKLKIERGFVSIILDLPDYYLFSSCLDTSRRMPTDFEAEAALVVRDKDAFVSRIRTALLNRHRGGTFLEGKIYYYDPYTDLPNGSPLEFWKHFSYLYQKEHRCILRPRDSTTELKPFFIEVGSLKDIAEAIFA